MNPNPTEVALSVQQPWAWLIVHGHKDVENRTWKRDFKGRIAVHAGLKMDIDAMRDLIRGIHPVTGEALHPALADSIAHADVRGEFYRGGIVGEATITGCSDNVDSQWFVGPYGFTLTDARPLPFRPLKGALGFFKVPA